MFNFLHKRKKEKFLFDQMATIGAKAIMSSLKCATALDTTFQSNMNVPLTPPVFSQITVEYLMLFIHLTDRVLFQLFGPKDRTPYIDVLVALISDTLKGDSFSESFPKFTKALDVKEKVRISPSMRNNADDYIVEGLSILMDTFSTDELNMRTVEYAKYKNIVPIGDGSPQGTLLWEFGKNISYIISNHRDDTENTKLSSDLAAKYYADMDLEALLRKIV